MPYPRGVGGPAARPIPLPSRLRLASALSMYTRNLDTKIFRKTLAFFGMLGGPPRSSPEGGLVLPRAMPSLPQCSCVPEPPKVRTVPKK